MAAFVALSGGIFAAWFAGEERIATAFAHLESLQHSPPFWLEVPDLTGQVLLLPTLVLFGIALFITRVLKRPTPWSRYVTAAILLTLAGRYVVWRTLTTLNFSTPANGAFSLLLLITELLFIASSAIQMLLFVNVRDRSREADRYSAAVLSGAYRPNVDVLVPTYNEPAFVLRRTIVGCQAMDYGNKRIYLLDDTRRPEIRQLALELGCEYITRPNNLHAKAGNLNHAIARTGGELIAVFDADFIPCKNFLTRTVGFFRNRKTALVQTPQSFYNSDPIAHNLGMEDTLLPEEEMFYRQVEPFRDGSGSVVCSGTSFVMRRSALEAVGGFVTNSISEDYFTGIKLAAEGYSAVFLDEKLSAGLAAESISAHVAQRLRWARGTLQGLFIDSNPLTLKGLSPLQRLGHFDGLLYWFASLSRVVLLMMPLACAFFGVIPMRASVEEMLFYCLPYYLLQVTVFSWLNGRARPALLSDLYSLLLAFPVAITTLQVMLRPFAVGFRVTPKGMTKTGFTLNWNLAWPVAISFAVSAFALWGNLLLSLTIGNDPAMAATSSGGDESRGVSIGFILSLYNLFMLGASLLVLLDAPKPHTYDWFKLRRIARLRLEDRVWWGTTAAIAEGGMEIELTQPTMQAIAPDAAQAVTVELVEEGLVFHGKMLQTGQAGDFQTVRLEFSPTDSAQRRHLIELLYCRPGQWKRRQAPGELQAIWLLLKIVLKPRILSRRRELKPMPVLQS
jgi:cellulose synthase (UDP-forming)